MTAKKVVNLPRKPRSYPPIPPPPKVTVSQAPAPEPPTAGEQAAAWLKANRYILAAVAVTIIVLAFVVGLFS